MALWAITATVAAIVLAAIFIFYRRQVKKTCRQLAFAQKYKTNLHLTSGLPFSELNELADEINGILDRSRNILFEAQQNETHLKETVTNLSHDIRTPLTSLDGYFQLLIQSSSKTEKQRYVGIIETRIESLKEMLEELFTYTKLQDGAYELSMKRIDFSRCVYDTVLAFYEDFQKKSMEPHVDFCNGHLYVYGNEEAIRRTVQNLVKNALTHGHTYISMEMQRKGDQAEFRCSNDAAHPEEIDMDRIFSRFYKADSARTHSSTGLGLSIAKGLTERMGGSISALLDNEIFTVSIKLPLD